VQELSPLIWSQAYLTGGTVRDLITGASLCRFDFTVEGDPTKSHANWKKAASEDL